MFSLAASEPDDIFITARQLVVPEARIFHIGQCLLYIFFLSHYFLFLSVVLFRSRSPEKGFPGRPLPSKSDSVSRQRFWHADITCYWLYSCCGARYVPAASLRTCTRCFRRVAMTVNRLTGTSTRSGTTCPTTSCLGTCPPGSRSSATWVHRRPPQSWTLCPNRRTCRSGNTMPLSGCPRRRPWRRPRPRKKKRTRPDSGKSSLIKRHKRYQLCCY